MSKKQIPAPVIAVLAENMPNMETHASLDNLFLYAEAPGNPPGGSKSVKTQAWLRIINKEAEEPLVVLGRLVEGYIEIPDDDNESPIWESSNTTKQDFKKKILSIFQRCNLQYINGGIITDGASISSKSLSDFIKGRNIPAIESEFSRALENVNSEPREAVSAACNILESIFKVYIADENLETPKKQDISGLWKVVKEDLGFDPRKLEDDDLKKILSGMFSIIDGIGAFRTHASSAHGQGRKLYNLKARHAKFAINSAHTLALFVLETWDEKKHN
jgi:hypothetical protein